MRLHWTPGFVAICMAQAVFGESTDTLRPLIETAANATGADYIAARTELVAVGSNGLPALVAISANSTEPWQIRLVAGIAAERIQRIADINALIAYDWRDDPEYDAKWDQSHAGPVLHLAPLVAKRCREKGLWLYYTEMVWKETGEHSRTAQMREDYWRGAYKVACEGAPVYGLMLKVAEDRVRKDIGFKKWETRGDLAYLANSKTNAVLPFLLEILPQVPVTDERNRKWYVRDWVNTLATPADVPMIENHYRERGEEVPELLRPQLEALKARSADPATSSK